MCVCSPEVFLSSYFIMRNYSKQPRGIYIDCDSYCPTILYLLIDNEDVMFPSVFIPSFLMVFTLNNLVFWPIYLFLDKQLTVMYPHLTSLLQCQKTIPVLPYFWSPDDKFLPIGRAFFFFPPLWVETFSQWIYCQWFWNSSKLMASLTAVISSPCCLIQNPDPCVPTVSLRVSINWHLVLWDASHLISKAAGVALSVGTVLQVSYDLIWNQGKFPLSAKILLASIWLTLCSSVSPLSPCLCVLSL